MPLESSVLTVYGHMMLMAIIVNNILGVFHLLCFGLAKS